MKKGIVLYWILLLVGAPYSFSQAVGDFTNQISIGEDYSQGSAKFANGKYEVLASGNDIGDVADGFYFVYKVIEGNFMITAQVDWGDQQTPGGSPTAGNALKKAGLMIRDSLSEPDAYGARNALVFFRNDLGANMQYRTTMDQTTTEKGLVNKRSDETNVMRLVRFGAYISMYRGTADGGFRMIGTVTVRTLAAKVMVGLAVTAHDINNIERAYFSNVSIKPITTGASVTRRLPSRVVIEATDTLKNIAVRPTLEEGKTADVVLKEKLPPGWSASEIIASSGTVDYANGIITWNLPSFFGSDALLNYNASPTAADTYGWTYFGGTITTGTDEFLIGGTDAAFVLPPRIGNLGIFDKNMNIFDTERVTGEGRYNPKDQTYYVLGTGHDIWDAADDFHFIYKEVSGTVSLKANVQLDAYQGETTWAKAGLMVRNDLIPASAYAFAMIRAGLGGKEFAPQWRPAEGEQAAWEGDAALVTRGTGDGQQDGTIEIFRDGSTVLFYYYDAATHEKVEWRSTDVDLEDPIYAGLVVTSHTTGRSSIGIFKNVSMTVNGKPVEPVNVQDWCLY